MSQYTTEFLETELNALLLGEIPDHPTQDIHDALEVAERLEAIGFAFQLKDMHPSSLSETGWKATFSLREDTFTAEHEHSAVAVCDAALQALRNGELA